MAGLDGRSSNVVVEDLRAQARRLETCRIRRAPLALLGSYGFKCRRELAKSE